MQIQHIPPAEFEIARRQAVRIAAAMARTLPRWIDTDVLAGEAEISVWYAAERYQPERAIPFPAWSVVVVKRRLLEEVRRQSPWTRLQRRLQRESVEAGTEPEGWMLPPLSVEAVVTEDGASLLDELVAPPDETLPDQHREVRLALSRLSPADRALLLRHYWLGMSDREIAPLLDVSTSRVTQRRMAALATLRAVVFTTGLVTQ